MFDHWIDPSRRLDGDVKFGGRDVHNTVNLTVRISPDEEGYIGRQCPDCRQLFRVHAQDWEDLPDDLRLWCVYCGHRDDHSEFITEQQFDRATRVAENYGEQMIRQTLDHSLRGLAQSTRNSLVSITYRPTPFHPQPLPAIDEERLVRERRCEICSLRYAVFGEHRFCSVCGLLSPPLIATDALAAVSAGLNAVMAVPETTLAELREQGVLDRACADTIKNLVGIVETLAEAVFRSRVGAADKVLRGMGNVFQRLDDSAELFNDHGLADLWGRLPKHWPDLQSTWATRHVLTHNDGIVDERYLAADSSTTLRLGQRVRVSEANARQAIAAVTKLCSALTDAWQPATDSSEP